MPKQLKYQRTTEEVEAIKKAMKSTSPKIARWATILYALHLGENPWDVAQHHNQSVATIYNVVKRYDEGGIEGLRPRAKPGRSRKLSDEQCEWLKQIVESDPQDHGFGFRIWTGKRLQSYIRQTYAIEVSEATVRNTLKRLGYVFRRPKFSPKHLQDPQQVERFKDLLQELKKEPNKVILGYSLWMKPRSI